jgi:hypothetical protein
MTASRCCRRFFVLGLSTLMALVSSVIPGPLPLTPTRLWAEDPPGDPLAEVYAQELRSSVESLMAQFGRERKYKVSDFPLPPDAFRLFQKDVVSTFAAALGLEDWVIRKPAPGKRSPIADKFKDRIVKRMTLESGVQIEAHVIELLATGDQVPIVLCLPAVAADAENDNRVPGIVCCPGHSRHALHDLVFGRDSYQRAIAVRLAEAGFAAVAVEKVDSGYLSRSAPSGVDEEAITTFRLGLGADTTRAVQLMATLAATEVLALHPRVDETRIGATGVSLGGWLAIQTALLSDRVGAVAEYATKTVFLGDDMKPDQFNGVGDICHIVPGTFQLGDRNVLMFPYAPRPLLSGHGGPSDRHSHSQYQRYYLDVHQAQYKALGKPENFRYHIHDGGHTIPPKTVIGFFRKQFQFPEN